MNAEELQKMKDEEYVKSLGYETNVQEQNLELEATTLFDYDKKTKEYLESLY